MHAAALHRRPVVRHCGEGQEVVFATMPGRAGDHIPWTSSPDHLNSTTLWYHRLKARAPQHPGRPPSRPRPSRPRLIHPRLIHPRPTRPLKRPSSPTGNASSCETPGGFVNSASNTGRRSPTGPCTKPIVCRTNSAWRSIGCASIRRPVRSIYAFFASKLFKTPCLFQGRLSNEPCGYRMVFTSATLYMGRRW